MSERRGSDLRGAVERKEARKLRARRRSDSVWFGLGMFGLIGWSVSIPMLIGLALGIWLDTLAPGTPSWTLTLMIMGVAVGCLNAWYWITRQRREIERERSDDGEGEP